MGFNCEFDLAQSNMSNMPIQILILQRTIIQVIPENNIQLLHNDSNMNELDHVDDNNHQPNISLQSQPEFIENNHEDINNQINKQNNGNILEKSDQRPSGSPRMGQALRTGHQIIGELSS